MLERAAVAAQDDREAAARVKFLHDGWAHAQLSVKAARLLTLSDPESTPERGRDALAALIRFRRAHEREWIGNFDHNAWVEDKSWQFGAEATTRTTAHTAAQP